MSLLEIILLAIGLSMDSFAVSISAGAAMKTFSPARALKIAAVLAIFQAAMPILGWIGGEHFKTLIQSTDHWIAFALLAFLGGKMILESLRNPSNENGSPCGCSSETYRPWRTRTLLCIAVATSIDALVVGISFSLLAINIALAAGIIFAVTFLSSLSGVRAGLHFGQRLGRWANLAGGIILLAIGAKILFEHLLFE